jgi:hypothetical protein
MAGMPISKFLPCIPTRGTKVPAGGDWLHEVKHDGFRMIVQRDGDRVRLFTRNGHDWTDRYPWIVDAARRLRQKQFVIDGEAVVLGVDGISDFAALYSRRHDDEVQFYAFDMLAVTAMICGRCRSRSGRPIWRGFWPAVATASSSRPSRPARSAPIYSGPPATWGWKVWSQSVRIGPIGQGARRIGSR